MNFHITADHVMIGLLSLFSIAILVSIIRQQRSATNTFNLFDLLMHDGTLSHAYVFATGGWVLHTWAVAYWTVQGTVKSDDFLIYSGIWITPVLAYIIKGANREAQPSKKEEP